MIALESTFTPAPGSPWFQLWAFDRTVRADVCPPTDAKPELRVVAWYHIGGYSVGPNEYAKAAPMTPAQWEAMPHQARADLILQLIEDALP